MTGILLDTHVLIWWRLDSGRLGRSRIQRLQDLENRQKPVTISAITLWETAMLAARGRIKIAEPVEVWLEEIEGHPLIEVLSLTARIAAESVRLGPDFHNDPADQIIVATARIHGLPLMTADERIIRWGKVPIY
ncbi:MAG: type II toxin-antitoxin system VapC family toxin [Acidobacteria bacterium]|nr:type II toxin-antitoxin system VapC family toxin [Acidobacteriota bacterium]